MERIEREGTKPKGGPTVNDEAAPYVGNVIARSPGACFRYVDDEARGGYPMRCPEPVAFRGVIVNLAGHRRGRHGPRPRPTTPAPASLPVPDGPACAYHLRPALWSACA
jgi:hypothetical protein